ncbi:NTPase KAP family P-loop domain-containing protein 1-like isoform X2 [Hyperolius riggenbachi]|uniref:NTPase KAP family P-loop domain-containing protein 1-like isoform X2 n=1 Tax=Hyperolius riggenbachi TaxID=752182 RepID=UPI0035A3102E
MDSNCCLICINTAERTENTQNGDCPTKTKPPSQSDMNKNKEDVFCDSVAKTLNLVRCPLTVGFYAPWGRGKNKLLNNVEDHLFTEEPKKERNWIVEVLKLMLRVTFFHPVIKDESKEEENKHYVFVRFSAWQYAGSDHLWAGLITNLCDNIEMEFGIFAISLYRALGGEAKTKTKGKSWVPKKRFSCIPLWWITSMAISLLAGLIFVIVCFQLYDYLSLSITACFSGITVLVPGVNIYKTIKNVFFTQKSVIKRKLNRTDISSQLGFMHDVKKEVEVLINYLKFMEVFRKQPIQVVLEITNLDRCMPDKVVGVLNAMNILLSDDNAPFISIVAVDPGVIVQCVEKSDLLKGMANNGYQYLNRTIELPICIPPMDEDAKLANLNEISTGKKQNTNENECGKKIRNSTAPNTHKKICGKDMVGSSLANGPLEKAKRYLKNDMKEYITDNIIHMKRILNTILLTIRLMENDSKVREYLNSNWRKVTKWVVLTTHWPCRMSWILQIIEDERQSRSNNDWTDIKDTNIWDFFKTSLEELDNIKMSIKNLLELDGDPEIFNKLLDDPKNMINNLTFYDATVLQQFTMNLDYSIKRQLELLQGSYNMLKFKVSTVGRITMWTLLNMTTDMVCETMDKIYNAGNIDDLNNYKIRIREHKLDGRAIVSTENRELKKALDMKIGDWVTFCTYFLRLPTPKLGSASSL